MIDKKIKKLALLGLVIAGIITGSVSAATVAEVPANVVASQNDISIVPKITYEQFPDSMVVKVVNVKRQDVVSVLWNGSDISSQLKKLEKAGHIIVSDDENGFTVEFDDPNLFENGEFGFSLINKPSATISTVISGDSSNTATINKVTVSKSSAKIVFQATLTDPYKVAGYVKYWDPKNCWFLCWRAANSADVTIVGESISKNGMLKPAKKVQVTVKTNAQGYFITKDPLYLCGFGFSAIATYNKKAVGNTNSPATFCSGTYTIPDLNIQ
ncbi:MAG: hypothetical protein WCL34_10820 [Methylococcaceae bacterium]